MKVIAQNKKAFHDYNILDRIEVGIVLTGDEVKSVRAGQVNLTGSFAHPRNSELYLVNCHIAPYGHAYKKEDQSTRTRKLLLHRRELNRLVGDISKKGVTLVPLKMYLSNKGFVKVEIGICKHKKSHESKEQLRERDIARETRRELKGKFRY
jgi:SsrA-binding protein